MSLNIDSQCCLNSLFNHIRGPSFTLYKCCRWSICIPGGHLGLWVGISVITLCEILGLLSYVIKHICHLGYRVLDPKKAELQPTAPERMDSVIFREYTGIENHVQPSTANQLRNDSHDQTNLSVSVEIEPEKKVMTHFSF